MASILRFRKLCILEPAKCSQLGFESSDKPISDGKQSYDAPKQIQREEEEEEICSGLAACGGAAVVQVSEKTKMTGRQPKKEWRCIDSCCWAIGYACTACWLLLLLYNCLPATLLRMRVPESPGARLGREGLTARHPVVLVPGIITGGLELWEGKPCFEGLFRRRLWGGSFTEMFKRLEFIFVFHPLCLYIYSIQLLEMC